MRDYILSKKSNRRKKVKKEKGFSLEEKLAAKPTDEGPRKRQNALTTTFSALRAAPSSVSRFATDTWR